MTWLADTAERRKAPRALWPEAHSIIVLGLNYGNGTDPLAILQHRRRGAISIYAKRADYHDVIKGKLKQLAGQRSGARRRRGEGLRRHRAGDGEAACGESRAWLARQAHQSRVTRLRIVAVPRLDLHNSGYRARRRGRRSLRRLPPLPRCVSHRRIHRALRDRCAHVHLLSHDRAQRAYRAAVSAARWATASIGCDDCLAVCPWNKFAKDAQDARLAVREEATIRRSRSSSFSTMRLSRSLPRHADQAHRTRPLRAQRADRRRQFRRPIARASCVEALLRRRLAARARHGGVGAVASCPTFKICCTAKRWSRRRVRPVGAQRMAVRKPHEPAVRVRPRLLRAGAWASPQHAGLDHRRHRAGREQGRPARSSAATKPRSSPASAATGA